MFGIRLFLIGIVATAIAGGGFYVFKLQKDNAILKANAIKMESAISEQKELIENQKADFQEILNANKEMNLLVSNLKKDLEDQSKRLEEIVIGLINAQKKLQTDFGKELARLEGSYRALANIIEKLIGKKK